MSLSKKARRDIAVFSRLQNKVRISDSEEPFTYGSPQLTQHEKALKLNARFDIERAQQQKRLNKGAK